MGEINPLEACTTSAGICSLHENIEKYSNVLNPGVMYTFFVIQMFLQRNEIVTQEEANGSYGPVSFMYIYESAKATTP